MFIVNIKHPPLNINYCLVYPGGYCIMTLLGQFGVEQQYPGSGGFMVQTGGNLQMIHLEKTKVCTFWHSYHNLLDCITKTLACLFVCLFVCLFI